MQTTFYNLLVDENTTTKRNVSIFCLDLILPFNVEGTSTSTKVSHVKDFTLYTSCCGFYEFYAIRRPLMTN